MVIAEAIAAMTAIVIPTRILMSSGFLSLPPLLRRLWTRLNSFRKLSKTDFVDFLDGRLIERSLLMFNTVAYAGLQEAEEKDPVAPEGNPETGEESPAGCSLKLMWSRSYCSANSPM